MHITNVMSRFSVHKHFHRNKATCGNHHFFFFAVFTDVDLVALPTNPTPQKQHFNGRSEDSLLYYLYPPNLQPRPSYLQNFG